MISHKELNSIKSFDDFLEKSIFTRDAKLKILKEFDERLAETHIAAIPDGIKKPLYDSSTIRIEYGEKLSISKVLFDIHDFSDLPFVYQVKLMKFNNILESFFRSIYQIYDRALSSCLTIETKVEMRLLDNYEMYSINRKSPGPKDVASSIIVKIQLEHNESYEFTLYIREEESLLTRGFSEEKVNELVVYYTKLNHKTEDSSLATVFEDDICEFIPFAQTNVVKMIDIDEKLYESRHGDYDTIIEAVLDHIDASDSGKDAYRRRLRHTNQIVNDTRIGVDEIDVDKELGINEIEIVEVVEESPKRSKSRFF
jgi:hypothetical protein